LIENRATATRKMQTKKAPVVRFQSNFKSIAIESAAKTAIKAEQRAQNDLPTAKNTAARR
jgi:hypothetical protein